MAGTPYTSPAWPKVRAAVLMRDNYQCQINSPRCTHTATECDHVIPWSIGGSWFDPTNLRAACKPCNSSNGAKLSHRHTPTPPTHTQPSRTW